MPPGQQPPPGAWLIRHPDDDRENVYVSVYDQARSGLVIVIRVFNAATGSFFSERTL